MRSNQPFADHLREVIAKRVRHEIEITDAQAARVLDQFGSMWREWIYAWDRYSQEGG